MKTIDKLDVMMDGRHVGTLASVNSRNMVAFEYSESWLRDGFSISPFSLPLREGVFMPKNSIYFDGLFGVFDDSLPDGWGRLLMDRKLGFKEIGALDRLAMLSPDSLGALEYVPNSFSETPGSDIDFDTMAEEAIRIYDMEDTGYFDEIFSAGGSSGGARPKVNAEIDGELWIVKFPTSHEDKDSGVGEYEYNKKARECGINVADSMLVPSNRCNGYFASKRFDRKSGKRVHMISASGLLESSHRLPALDYIDLMKLTMILTRDMEAVCEMYRRMCFNVLFHNRDDHGKNFAFLYDEERGAWELSPAYDLTNSSSMNGEHATTVNGNGIDPGRDEILEGAKKAGIPPDRAEEIFETVNEIKRS